MVKHPVLDLLRQHGGQNGLDGLFDGLCLLLHRNVVGDDDDLLDLSEVGLAEQIAQQIAEHLRIKFRLVAQRRPALALFDDQAVDAQGAESIADGGKDLVADGLAILGGVEVFEIESGFDQVVFEVIENRSDLKRASFGDAGQGEEAGSFRREIEIAPPRQERCNDSDSSRPLPPFPPALSFFGLREPEKETLFSGLIFPLK